MLKNNARMWLKDCKWAEKVSLKGDYLNKKLNFFESCRISIAGENPGDNDEVERRAWKGGWWQRRCAESMSFKNPRLWCKTI